MREDDSVTLGSDPVLARYRHHFYNPLDGSGLHFRGVTGMPAPVWGIEFRPISGQDFSFTDARQYFYQALIAPDPADREHSLARTFLTLGHVIHLIQDSAQPQHTRNDSHGPWPFGGRSFYERYTEQNLDRLTAAQLFGGYAPVYGDDDTSTFNFVYDFWHRAGGMGLADYSNRGFVSARTNFRITDWAPLNLLPNVNFPKPDNDGATIEPVAIGDLPGMSGTGLAGDVDFIATPVIDSYRPVDPPEVNHRTSSYSIFDPDLEHYNRWVTHIADDGTPYQTRAEFNLNKFNFEAAWPFLIPRAVGYSAGLINYFFRGKIDFVPDPNDPNGYLIKNLGPDDLNGTFELCYDDADGNRQLVPGANQWQLSILAAAHCPNGTVCNQASVQAFDVAFDPPPSGTYTLVFHGTMGDELGGQDQLGAVAAKVLHASSFLLVTHYATYQSAFLDHGWRRLGSGIGTPYLGYGNYIKPGLLYFHGSNTWPLEFRSTDGGRTFTDINNDPYYIGGPDVFDVQAVGPSELIGNYLDFGRYPSRGFPSFGISLSRDFGNSWSSVELYGGSGTSFLGSIETFVLPQGLFYIGNNTMYQAYWVSLLTPDGWTGGYDSLFMSSDLGESWSLVDVPTLAACQGERFAWNGLEGERRVILGFGEPCHGGILKSVDGVTWTPVSEELAFSAAIAPDGSALLTKEAGLMKSTDRGDTWTVAQAPPIDFANVCASVVYMGTAPTPP